MLFQKFVHSSSPWFDLHMGGVSRTVFIEVGWSIPFPLAADHGLGIQKQPCNRKLHHAVLILWHCVLKIIELSAWGEMRSHHHIHIRLHLELCGGIWGAAIDGRWVIKFQRSSDHSRGQYPPPIPFSMINLSIGRVGGPKHALSVR